MKSSRFFPLAALALFATPACDRKSPDTDRKIAELERKNQESADRQHELEQTLEDQKLAAERDAIERERLRIEDDRAALERQQGDARAQQDEALRAREESLAKREGRLEQSQSALDEKQDDLQERKTRLSERERDLAGREALPFVADSQPTVPVADYGLFYDSLSSYGSWFETPSYGYVWQPVVVRDSGWRPYSRGRWVCSDRGWNWISEEPFGWATYHYGRWTLLRGHGWVWVPGSQWAPCWVSWRQNDSHVGWAPLPPETLGYHGQVWDSTVDVQFSISSACYTFLEIRHFGESIFSNCLPITRNRDFWDRTRNITFIHYQDRNVICGGPKYREFSDRIGKPLPFYRIEMDRHAQSGRDASGLRPRVEGDHLVVSAPHMDAEWNGGLKPKRVKERFESVEVERERPLAPEISDHYRQSRDENRQKAVSAIADLGGEEHFDERRSERLQENKRKLTGKTDGRAKISKADAPADRDVRPAVRPQVPQPENTPATDRARGEDTRKKLPAIPASRETPAKVPKVRPQDVPQRDEPNPPAVPKESGRREEARSGQGRALDPQAPEEMQTPVEPTDRKAKTLPPAGKPVREKEKAQPEPPAIEEQPPAADPPSQPEISTETPPDSAVDGPSPEIPATPLQDEPPQRENGMKREPQPPLHDDRVSPKKDDSRPQQADPIPQEKQRPRPQNETPTTEQRKDRGDQQPAPQRDTQTEKQKQQQQAAERQQQAELQLREQARQSQMEAQQQQREAQAQKQKQQQQAAERQQQQDQLQQQQQLREQTRQNQLQAQQQQQAELARQRQAAAQQQEKQARQMEAQRNQEQQQQQDEARQQKEDQSRQRQQQEENQRQRQQEDGQQAERAQRQQQEQSQRKEEDRQKQEDAKKRK